MSEASSNATPLASGAPSIARTIVDGYSSVATEDFTSEVAVAENALPPSVGLKTPSAKKDEHEVGNMGIFCGDGDGSHANRSTIANSPNAPVKL